MQEFTRRRFVEGLSVGLGLGSGGLWLPRVQAQAANAVLTGPAIDLEIHSLPVDITGRPRLAMAVNGSLPGPTLRWREGEEVTIRVTNRLDEPTSIHWHGIVLPWQMDGVPGVSYAGIAPGAQFVYRFRLRQSGTYWYHSHTGFQEQLGVYGAIVIEPAEPDPVAYDREHTIVLSDWTDADPMRIFARLKKESHYYNFNRRTLADMRAEIGAKGFAAARKDRAMWNRMRMTDRDIADVTGAAYTYLVNGQPPAANWTGSFRHGERVRLRIVNASAMTLFDLRIPDLDMTVVAADGNDVEPVTVRELRIGPAETYDLIVRPNDDTAYTIFAQSIDRSGYARATLTPDAALTAVVPAMDAPPVLGMVDMGMGGTAMGGMGMVGMGMGGTAMSGADMGGPLPPGVDMRAENPLPRLDDPGVGLRDRSWPVLSYGQLVRLGGGPPATEAQREIELHLTGNMHRYMWSFDGLRYSDAEPIELELGERLRFVLVNDTMMNHPIHLHGLWSDLETGEDGQYARKHTVLVQPGQRIAYGVTADAPGPWAYHCHLLHHMEAGMLRVVNVSGS